MNNIKDYRIPKTSHLYSFEWGKNAMLNMAAQSQEAPPSKWKSQSSRQGSRGLMDRALDLKPEVTQGCVVRIPAPAGIVHDWGETLEQGTEPQTAPRAPHSRLPTAPLGWVKCREHISLLIIRCIIVYVTNKAHLSLKLQLPWKIRFL